MNWFKWYLTTQTIILRRSEKSRNFCLNGCSKLKMTLFSLVEMGLGLQEELISSAHQNKQWHWTTEWITEIQLPKAQKKVLCHTTSNYIDWQFLRRHLQKVSLFSYMVLFDRTLSLVSWNLFPDKSSTKTCKFWSFWTPVMSFWRHATIFQFFSLRMKGASQYPTEINFTWTTFLDICKEYIVSKQDFRLFDRQKTSNLCLSDCDD